MRLSDGHCFAYKWLDSVKINKNANFYPSKPFQELWVFSLSKASSAKLRHRFAYQYVDNVKIYKYANSI